MEDVNESEIEYRVTQLAKWITAKSILKWRESNNNTYTVESVSCSGEQRIHRFNEADTNGANGRVLVMMMMLVLVLVLAVGRSTLHLLIHGADKVHRREVVSVVVVVVADIHCQIHRHGNGARQGAGGGGGTAVVVVVVVVSCGRLLVVSAGRG